VEWLKVCALSSSPSTTKKKERKYPIQKGWWSGSSGKSTCSASVKPLFQTPVPQKKKKKREKKRRRKGKEMQGGNKQY
jgi:hypothetical protein